MPHSAVPAGFSQNALAYSAKNYAANPRSETLNQLRCSIGEAKSKGIEQLDLSGQLDKSQFKSRRSGGRYDASVRICNALAELLIKDNPIIQEINLADCYLTAKGRTAIMESVSIANTALRHLNISTPRGTSDGNKLRGFEMLSINKLLRESRSLTAFRIGEVVPEQRNELVKAATLNPVLQEISFGGDTIQLRPPLAEALVPPQDDQALEDGLMFNLHDLASDQILQNAPIGQQPKDRNTSGSGPIWRQFSDWAADPSQK